MMTSKHVEYGARLLCVGLLAFAAASMARSEEAPTVDEIPAETPEAADPETGETPEVDLTTTEPAAPERYKVRVRPAFWLAWSSSSFWKAGLPGARVVSPEDDLGGRDVHVVLPLEVLARTENNEFRFRYLWWNSEASSQFTGDFGNLSFLNQEATATLGTHVIGVDFLHRVVDHINFDLYITVGGDLFITKMELSGAPGTESIEETVPILTVGLGVRFPLNIDWSVYASSSALSYSQLLGMDEAFFDVKDVYRNIEVSVIRHVSDKFSWGAGWKHYEVGFKNTTLDASHEMKGPCIWASLQF